MDEGAPLEWELRAQEQARRGLAWERGRKRVVILLAVITVLAIAGGTVWALQSDSIRHREAPRAFRQAEVPATIATRVKLDCRSPLTSDEPLRIWIAGDSLAGSLGPALGEMTGETGVVKPTFDTRPSSGLTSPNFFDWPEHAREEVARLDPEVVVFIIGANDSAIAYDETRDENGALAWRGRYAQLVNEMLAIFAGDGRSVIWIGGPTLRDPGKDNGVRQLDQVAHDVVTLHPRSTYVDAYQLFGDEAGDYTPTLPGADGRPVRVRTSDGVHFTPAGARLLARNIFQILDGQCEIREQTDSAHPQSVDQSPGSGGPTGSESGSGDNGGGSSPTAPPTAPPPSTSPPSTSPPTTLISLPVSVGPI